jgi:vacuolar-type H+-ATPase subunit H
MESDRPSSLSGSERAAGNQATWATGTTPAPPGSVRASIDDMTSQMQAVVEAAERAADAIRLDAEEQARRHIDEARRKADRLTAERAGLISDLTDDLLRQATNIRDHSERMATALEDAIASFDGILKGSASNHSPAPADSPRVNGQAPPPGGVVQAAPPPPGHEEGSVRTYTDIIGAPPPPLPATAPAPTPAPEHHPLPDPTGPPQPTIEAAEAASAYPAEPTSPDLPLDVVMYATRRAANGVDPDVIASELRLRYGVEDPAPIINRVMDPARRRD